MGGFGFRGFLGSVVKSRVLGGLVFRGLWMWESEVEEFWGGQETSFMRSLVSGPRGACG